MILLRFFHFFIITPFGRKKIKLSSMELHTLNTMFVKLMKWILDISCQDEYYGRTRKLKVENTESAFVFLEKIFVVVCVLVGLMKNCCRNEASVGRASYNVSWYFGGKPTCWAFIHRWSRAISSKNFPLPLNSDK